MRILHIFDKDCFGLYARTISELVTALFEYRKIHVDQAAYAMHGADDHGLGRIIQFEYWRPSVWRGGMLASRACARFAPDAVIKWGIGARRLDPGGDFIQLSFIGAPGEIRGVAKSDYVVANSESILAHAKSHGFSGAKSFLLPPFAHEYRGAPEVTKRNLFIPEKSRVAYIAGTFLKGIGFEQALEAVASVPNIYFAISGGGRDEEAITDYMARVNVRSRARISREPERALGLLKISDIALLPMAESPVVKNMIEAARARRPIITTANPYSADFADGTNSISVPFGDANLLRQAMKRALEADDLDAMITRAGKTAGQFEEQGAVSGFLSNLALLIDKYRTRRNLMA
ncbi:MAG: glycosyltransferase [Rickettsiales bacterium]|jgi:glycosyltransferase involved in cell wall biosynthesis|nr:glycosyltransferase [Rickettsiales bacterium]